MANLENNNDKENKSVTGHIKDSVHKGMEKAQETAKHITEMASDAIHHPAETAEVIIDYVKKDVPSTKWWAKLLQIIFWSFFILFSVFIIAINLPATKNWIAQKVITQLNKSLKSQFSFESVDVDFFGDVAIHEVTIKDHKNFPFIKAKQLSASSDWLSIIFNSRDLKFQSISLDKMDAKVITYKGDSIANFVKFIQIFDSGPADPNKPPFQLSSRISITNSKISIINQNHDGDQGKWLDANEVNLLISGLKVKGPNVDAKINNLSFITERWGKKHKIETFSTDFSYTKQLLHLNDLTINTDHSLIQGDIKFNINNGSWDGFEKKVKMEVDLKPGSKLSGYDLSYFVTDWDNYRPINMSGALVGALDNFNLENFVISNQKVSVRTSYMRVEHFLKGDFLVDTKNLSTDFTYVDLKEMLPSFIAKNLKNIADDFGRMKYSGSLNATQKQIYISGAQLITGIGQAKLSQFFLNSYLSPVPKFRGYAELKDFNTSVVSKNKQVGLLTGKFNFEGEAFDVNTMKLKTKSEITSIEINNKTINNIHLDGVLDHKKYNGIINVNDEQAKANVRGLIDFSTPKLYANIDADVKYLNLNYFSGASGNQIMSGLINGKISMTSINDLAVDTDFKNLSFNNGTSKIELPNSKVQTYLENGSRVIDVDSPGAVKGGISGKFSLNNLSGMMQNAMDKILVGTSPRRLYSGENFNFDFQVEQGLVNYFAPNVIIPQGAKASGTYDGSTNNLLLNADVASLKYIMTKTEEVTDVDKVLAEANPSYKLSDSKIMRDSAMVGGISVRINTANLNEQIFAKVLRAEYNKTVFKDVALSGRNEDDKLLRLSTTFKMGSPKDEADNKLKDYAVNLSQTTDSLGDYVFKFEPTSIKYNGVVWNVDTTPELGHSITYRKKAGDFLIQNFRVFSEDSEAVVKNALFKSSKDFEVDAEIKNMDISKIMLMQTGENSIDIHGVANGNLRIKMNKNTLEPIVAMNVDKIKMNGKSMGNFIIDVQNSDTPNVFEVKGGIVDTGIIGGKYLDVTGTINNNTSKPTLDLSAEMKDFDLAFANEFVKAVFSNMRGRANGILKITGLLDDVDYSGDIALHGFGLRLNFTGVDYSTDDTVINLSKGRAILNNIGIKDGRENSAGSISGGIYFETLSSMAVELVLSAQNLLVLNTTQSDFDLFWGRIYGQGDLFISGPVSGLSVETSRKNPFKALNNSVFTFNSGSTSGVDEYKMLRFLKEDNSGEISVENKKQNGANMNVDFMVAVDKGTTVNVLVGDDVGDISVRGTSNALRFHMSRQGNIEMNGAYAVDNGTYVSKAILEKTFQIAKGSVIRWDGDAMAPNLDITANYIRTVSNAGEYLNMGTSLPPLKIQLQTKITGTLNNPDPQFEVMAPDVSSQIKETLATKMSNMDEKVIQFGSILLMSNFNVTSNGGFDLNTSNLLQSSGYNLLFKQLSSVFNTISSQFNIDFNYLKSDPTSNASDIASTNVNFSLSPRVTIKTGFGIPLSKNQSISNSNSYLSGEGTVEYDDSKNNDGSRIYRIYSKPSNLGLIPSSGNASANQSYGMGVVWSKNFNTIFKKSKKNIKEEVRHPVAKKDSAKKDTLK